MNSLVRKIGIIIGSIFALLLIFGFIVRSIIFQPTPLSHGPLRSISMISDDEGWAIGETTVYPGYTLLHYVDNKWNLVASPEKAKANSTLVDISVLSQQEIWAIGNEPVPLSDGRSYKQGGFFLHYNGHAWKYVGITLQDTLVAIKMIGVHDGWACGAAGVFHYDGETWKSIPNVTIENCSYIMALSSSDIWFVTSGNKLLHYVNSSWSVIPLPSQSSITHLVMETPERGWLVGHLSDGVSSLLTPFYRGTIQIGGEEVLQNVWINDIAINSPSDIWAVGRGKSIAHYNGITWRVISSPTSQGLNKITFSSPHYGWAVGDQGTRVYYRDGKWETYVSAFGRTDGI
jgi:hypothetical protein